MKLQNLSQRALSLVLAIIICLMSLPSGFASQTLDFRPKSWPRYHNPDTGRFWTQDSFEGFGSDPTSLHKYTYCGNNPANAFDPSGNFSLVELGHSAMIGGLTTAWIGSISRAAGAASAGAGWKGSLDAANEGAGARAGMRRAATLEAKHFKTSAGQLIAQMNAKFSGGEIGQPTHLINRFVTRAAGDDDFHTPRNFCRTSNGIVSKSSKVRKSIVLNCRSSAGGPHILAPRVR